MMKNNNRILHTLTHFPASIQNSEVFNWPWNNSLQLILKVLKCKSDSACSRLACRFSYQGARLPRQRASEEMLYSLNITPKQRHVSYASRSIIALWHVSSHMHLELFAFSSYFTVSSTERNHCTCGFLHVILIGSQTWSFFTWNLKHTFPGVAGNRETTLPSTGPSYLLGTILD